MKKTISALLALLAAFALFSLSSCEETDKEPPEVHSRTFFEYFDTFGTVYDYSGATREEFEKNADRIMALMKEYHELFDIYNEYSGIANIATINKNAGKGPVSVDEKIIDLLEFSKEMYSVTNGECNVAFGAVLRIWHDYRSEGVAVPTRTELEAAALHCNMEDVIIDRAAGTVELRDPLMSLDVGAVAKGYTAEKLAEFIKSEGLSSYALDLGGNLRVVGTKPDGSGWSSGVANPYGSDYLARIELRDSALVTSGSYSRYYVVDGVRYHHIIDKDTLAPKNDCVSVSIHAPSSAVADALSTAVFNMDISSAKALIEGLDGVSAVILTSDGDVVKIGAAFV